MIEPSGKPISLPPNRQTKVPGMGMDQHAFGKQMHVSPQAQDDKGFGSLSNAGLADMVPGKTQRLDDCLTQGQDSGSHQARVPGGGNLSIPAGSSSVDFVSPWFASTKAQGQQPKPGRGDIGVNTSSVNGMPPGTLD